VTSKQCKNPRCWNPLHVKSRFNVKPFPKTVQPLITKINITKSQEFQSRSLSIEEELTPKLKLIKSPKENKEVDIGSPFRPLESQFLSDLHDDRLNK
jgi:superfamily I DNA and RNA helicase